jgi:hypothetical protein
LKNRGNSYLNIEATSLVHVKIKIEYGQGSTSRLGLGLDVEKEDLIKTNS